MRPFFTQGKNFMIKFYFLYFMSFEGFSICRFQGLSLIHRLSYLVDNGLLYFTLVIGV